jgi:hypothetical protein
MPKREPTIEPAVRESAAAGLGLVTLVSAYVLLAGPDPVQAGRHLRAADAPSIHWVAAPQDQANVTAAPAVTHPTAFLGFPPPLRDPMVVAAAVLEQHHLVVLSLRGGLYGP